MTAEEEALVTEYLELHKRLSENTSTSEGSFELNYDKNLILIVVESLNAWVVDYEYNGQKVMPYLSELVKADGIISNKEMLSQIHSGISSDGQFIYNTGLYASSNCVAVSEYMDNDLPALAKIFSDRPTFEIICETPNMWNHLKSNKAYGYKDFIYNTDYRARKEKTGRDEMMFKTALEVMDTVPKPFYGLFVTMSMHAPFVDKYVPRSGFINDIPGQTETMKDYLNVCNYFDECLEGFITALKENGLYDSSIIAIASDHSTFVEGSGYDNTYCKTVFVLAGSGVTHHSEVPMGQIDVFPTLLQVMGRYDYEAYCGMGLSIFNPVLRGGIDGKSNVHGDSLSADFERMLKISPDVANLMLRADKCKME